MSKCWVDIVGRKDVGHGKAGTKSRSVLALWRELAQLYSPFLAWVPGDREDRVGLVLVKEGTQW